MEMLQVCIMIINRIQQGIRKGQALEFRQELSDFNFNSNITVFFCWSSLYSFKCHFNYYPCYHCIVVLIYNFIFIFICSVKALNKCNPENEHYGGRPNVTASICGCPVNFKSSPAYLPT